MAKIIIYTTTNELEFNFTGNLEKELRDKISKKGLLDVNVNGKRLVINCASIESYEIEGDSKPVLSGYVQPKETLTEKELQYIKQPMLRDRENAERARKQLVEEQSSVFSNAIKKHLNPENQVNITEIKKRGRKPKSKE